jgi:hypothetical protein
VLHFKLEPVNALGFEKDGVFEIHAGNQALGFILPVLSKALQVPPEQVVLRTYNPDKFNQIVSRFVARSSFFEKRIAAG